MQETSSLYKRLLADPGHWKEYTLAIGESGVLVTNQGDRITFGSKLYREEVRGSVIQLEGTTENPLTGLTIFGKTTQNGTPTPEAPVPLVSAGDGGSLGVTVAGKNLFYIPVGKTSTVRGVTMAVQADGSILANGTKTESAESNIYHQNIPAAAYAGKTMTLRSDMKNIRVQVNAKQADGTTVYLNAKNGTKTIVIPENTKTIGWQVSIDGTGSYSNVVIHPYAVFGTETGEWEPYTEQTLTISTPNGLPGIPVTSGGNYTDENGQQWVCDEVDFGRGVYVQRVDTVDMGTLEWLGGNDYDASKKIYRYRHNNLNVEKGTSRKIPLMTSYGYTCKSNGESFAWWDNAIYIANGTLYVHDSATTATDFVEKISGCVLLYPIATPIETALSTEELAAYAALHTNYPNTTILNDGGADMIVGYLLNGEGPINILVASSGADSGFHESSIISMSTQKSIFSESNPSVGNCIAGQITVDMMKPKGDIPRRARLAPYVRLTNGKEYSEWLQKGVFFIDHREYSGDENERMTVYGYDHIILTEDEFPSSTHTWPRKDIDVVKDITNEIGTSIDRRTVQIMNKGYKINYPAGYSMREVLENIAAMYAGSFIMSDTGELLLVTMFGIPKETSYLIDNVGFAITFGGDRILV